MDKQIVFLVQQHWTKDAEIGTIFFDAKTASDYANKRNRSKKQLNPKDESFFDVHEVEVDRPIPGNPRFT